LHQKKNGDEVGSCAVVDPSFPQSEASAWARLQRDFHMRTGEEEDIGIFTHQASLAQDQCTRILVSYIHQQFELFQSAPKK
jgi:hypothetical protein